jgi:bifunctional UDP-N-acetylglucosamine pyrophosphorylase/glucosamine-1-phosphate N-acetyltransferase
MKSSQSKVMHAVAGQPMVRHVLNTAAALEPDRLVVVVGPDMDAVAAEVAPHPTVVQHDRLGTAHALMAARDAVLRGGDGGGDVLILYGDGPLITPETLWHMLEKRRNGDADFVWLGFRPDDPTGYGRMKTVDGDGLSEIVEQKDASEADLRIGLCWAGLLLGRADALFSVAARIGNDNAKGEYYLTDAVHLGAEAGYRSVVVETPDPEEVLGVNSRAELAVAERVMQRRLRARAMADGATLIDPDTVWFSVDTRLGRDVVVHPNVVFAPGVTVGDGVEILSFSHLEGAQVADGARIGPFARLRPGTRLGAAARVGNFVEVKAASVGPGAKLNHLSYVGDADVGAGANVGAGTITCNYDGFAKSRTVIGEKAFIGSNTALVAPVTIGKGAMIGAGSTITRDVPDDALGVARGMQNVREGGAARFREIRAARKKKG